VFPNISWISLEELKQRIAERLPHSPRSGPRPAAGCSPARIVDADNLEHLYLAICVLTSISAACAT
jgi:hypothetical protein